MFFSSYYHFNNKGSVAKIVNNDLNYITRFKNITQLNTGNIENMNHGGLIMG